MGGSLLINILIYMHNGGSPVTSSIGLNTNVYDSPNNTFGRLAVDNVWVYTPIGSPKHNSKCGLNTNGWFTNYQGCGLRTLVGLAKT